jgi:glycerate-2-kinase
MLHVIKEVNNRVLSGRTVVVGMGKAAAAMAMAVESHWVGELSGVVVVAEGASRPLQRIRVLESSHPVPDELAVQAYPAKVVTLLISDIPGDEPSLIAFGPAVQATVEGLTGHILSDAMEGEARELVKAHGWVR